MKIIANNAAPLLLLISSFSLAAQAPKSEEKLASEATHVVKDTIKGQETAEMREGIIARVTEHLKKVKADHGMNALTYAEVKRVDHQLSQNLHELIKREGGAIADLQADWLADYETVRAYLTDCGVLFTTYKERQRSGRYRLLAGLAEFEPNVIWVTPAFDNIPGIDPAKLTDAQKKPIEVRVLGRTLVPMDAAWYKPVGLTISYRSQKREPMAVIFPEAIAAEADKRQARGDFGADRSREFAANLREIALGNEVGHVMFRQATGATKDKVSNSANVGSHNGKNLIVLDVSEAYSDYHSVLRCGKNTSQLADFLLISGALDGQNITQYRFSKDMMKGEILELTETDQRFSAIDPEDSEFMDKLGEILRADQAFAQRLQQSILKQYQSVLSEPIAAISNLAAQAP